MRYVQLGQASLVQDDNNLDLEETIRQAEQKFTTDLKTIATETTNDGKFLKYLKTLVCLDRRSIEQIADEYKAYQKKRLTRLGVVFYDDRIFLTKVFRNRIIKLLQKVHASITKMTTAAKPFWWQEWQETH